MRSRAFLLLFILAASGCVDTETREPAPKAPADVELSLGAPVEQLHDHTDAALHTGRAGLRLVNWSALIPEELGSEGFAALRIVDNWAFIGTDGAHAGFLIVDVSDPRSPVLVSQYSTPGGASQEAVPTSDGNFVFMNLQRQPAPADILANPLAGDGWGIQIVDVRDKANPKLDSFVPVEVQGTHVMFYAEHAGKKYVIYNGQPVRQLIPTGEAYTLPPGNSVKITEFVELPTGGHTLRPVSEFRLPDGISARTQQGCFPHDQWAEEHPITKQWLLYVAHWDCGAVIVDISDPAMPALLHVDNQIEPSTRLRVHYFRPDPSLRDGRVIAWSGPEIDISPGEPGYLRSYDATDPTKFSQIGAWRLPGEVENDKPFIFSPHNFDFRGDLLALAHYHAGVWVLNVSDPKSPHAVAYYFPHGDESQPFQGTVWRKTPNFPEAYFPNVYEAKWFTSPTDGESYLLVTERGSGLYVLKMDS